jgi:predicted dinucleotide-binding enzyme
MAKLLGRAKHEVMLSGYRDEGKARTLARSLGCKVGSLEEARDFGEVFFLCVPHVVALDTVQLLGAKRGVLVDCTNQFGGTVPGGAFSTSEYLSKLTPDMIVVKAFNTLRFDMLASRTNTDPLTVMVYSTDNAAAAGIIQTLILDCGYAPLNLGPLANGVLQEPTGPFFLKVLDINEANRIAREFESAEGLEPASRPD